MPHATALGVSRFLNLGRAATTTPAQPNGETAPPEFEIEVGPTTHDHSLPPSRGDASSSRLGSPCELAFPPDSVMCSFRSSTSTAAYI